MDPTLLWTEIKKSGDKALEEENCHGNSILQRKYNFVKQELELKIIAFLSCEKACCT